VLGPSSAIEPVLEGLLYHTGMRTVPELEPAVAAEADALPSDPEPGEPGRVDLRSLLTSTIGAQAACLVPEVDEVGIYDPPWMKATEVRVDGDSDRAMIERLRRQDYDAAVIFTVYSQSAQPAALLVALADIPLRLAHCRENPYGLLTDWVREPEPEGFIRHEVRRHLDKALGDLSEDVLVEKLFSKPASVSPTGTPLWDVLGRVVDRHYPGAKLLPRLIVGFTDAPYFREHGAIAYGFGLFSRALTAEAMAGRFHGNDERVDVASLGLTTQAWLETCELLLG